MLFVWEGLVFGFLVFCFDGLFTFWAQPPFSQAPIDTHFGIDITLTLIITITYFTLRQRAKRINKEEEKAATLAEQDARTRSAKENEDRKWRKLEESQQVSRDRAEQHERNIERVRANRAMEIAELEQELARYKNIPSDEETHE
jgi:uncharacterized membrane protein YhiD involved in acid resistance